jgi:hypothetical protein
MRGASPPSSPRPQLQRQAENGERDAEEDGKLDQVARATRAARARVRAEQRSGRNVRGQRTAARAGDLTHRGHRRACERIALSPTRHAQTPDERARVRAIDSRAGHAEAERSDDDDRPLRGHTELSAHEIGVPLRGAKHRGVVRQISLIRNQGDLDRSAPPRGLLQEAEQTKLDRLGGAVGERRIEELGLEVVARRVAVPPRAAGGGEREEHGDDGG